jgi:transposase-like protein
MKKTYQINKQKALKTFREASEAAQTPIQLVMALPELVKMAQQGLMSMALSVFMQIAQEMMNWDVSQLVGPKNQAQGDRENYRWGSEQGYCVVGGQKVPLKRPRVRDKRQREVALGSYEMLQQASLMDDAVWKKIMHGLTMRKYSEVVRELEQVYGIEKSTISDHFIEASRLRLDRLMKRSLTEHKFCALLMDGTPFCDQQMIVSIGITLQGQKVLLGLRQGATENATVVKHLLEDLRDRGVDFEVPRLYLLDGGKALHSAVKHMAGKAAFVQRCQVHKIRNVVEHLADEHQTWARLKMRNAYASSQYETAKKTLQGLLRELMDLNPSAARSLEEGMEETLTMHQLRVPNTLRKSLASTNIIESAFSLVETVCRNVKRWQGGDQYLRWVGSGLLLAESRWNRIHGYKEIPILVKELELAAVKAMPLKYATVAS